MKAHGLTDEVGQVPVAGEKEAGNAMIGFKVQVFLCLVWPHLAGGQMEGFAVLGEALHQDGYAAFLE